MFKRTHHIDVRDALSYNPDTGVFVWRVTRHVRAGTPAGYVDPDGRRYVTVSKRRYRTSILAWFFFYGVWPTSEVDHRDRDTGNDRIANLRLATRAENAANRGRQSNNTSGFIGVSFHKPTGRFQAYVMKDQRATFLGRFDTAEEAARVRDAAAAAIHGTFASLNAAR